MNRKKITTKHILIAIIILIIVVIAIFSFTLKNNKQPNKLESFIKDTTISIEKVLFWPFKFIIDKVEDYKLLINIRQKYQLLLPEVSRIESLNAENIELRRQIEALKQELNITYTINEYEFLNATVISRNVANWYNTITIDKGTYNGVTTDMVVVNSQGLIGKIVSTTTFTSEIRLITTSDTANKISVTIASEGKKINGLIKDYNYKTKHLEVEGVSNTEYVGIGDYVYTSGLGEIFPSGILIGKVERITTDEYDLAKIIEVKPIADFDDINYVAILKRKELTK
ncbi:MAG: rod shape-determining protein MreC [Mycoplasmatota bacterium]|nr:rod shape-determining protein MreC [Mycoplasmatota bacterium]